MLLGVTSLSPGYLIEVDAYAVIDDRIIEGGVKGTVGIEPIAPAGLRPRSTARGRGKRPESPRRTIAR